MNQPSLSERIEMLRRAGFNPVRFQQELDLLVLMSKIELLEKEVGEKVETSISERVRRWGSLGWHPDRVTYELEALTKILEIKANEKKCPKPEGRDEHACSKFPMTNSQVAAKLGISKDTLRRWLDDLNIDPPRTRGGHARINRAIFKQLRGRFERSARYS